MKLARGTLLASCQNQFGRIGFGGRTKIKMIFVSFTGGLPYMCVTDNTLARYARHTDHAHLNNSVKYHPLV